MIKYLQEQYGDKVEVNEERLELEQLRKEMRKIKLDKLEEGEVDSDSSVRRFFYCRLKTRKIKIE